jgi:hypothetical protein
MRFDRDAVTNLKVLDIVSQPLNFSGAFVPQYKGCLNGSMKTWKTHEQIAEAEISGVEPARHK